MSWLLHALDFVIQHRGWFIGGFVLSCVAAYCGIALMFFAHQDAMLLRDERDNEVAYEAHRRQELSALSLDTGGLAQAIADYEANELRDVVKH